MPLTKVKPGNMYQDKDFVTHTHTHLRGKCPHACSYCSIQHGTAARTGHYSGDLRLEEKEFAVKYGSGKKIFLEHCSDLFAYSVQDAWIDRILDHAAQWPGNEYVVQTKNPVRMMSRGFGQKPWAENFVLGTTIESDVLWAPMGNAPHPHFRFVGGLSFLTIEPIMDFSAHFGDRILRMDPRPHWVNIGADSKRCRLPEPHPDDIRRLITDLRAGGIEVRLKSNLKRLLPEEE